MSRSGYVWTLPVTRGTPLRHRTPSGVWIELSLVETCLSSFQRNVFYPFYNLHVKETIDFLFYLILNVSINSCLIGLEGGESGRVVINLIHFLLSIKPLFLDSLRWKIGIYVSYGMNMSLILNSEFTALCLLKVL